MQIGMFLKIKFGAQGIKAKLSSKEVHKVLRHHLPTAHFTCSSLTYSSSYPGFQTRPCKHIFLLLSHKVKHK